MDKNNFDHIIKAKLAELEQASNLENDWELFFSLYADELVDKDVVFDQNIATTMSSFEVPYKSSHWPIMKERLEKEEFIRTSIYFSKIIEAGCIFLILFTFLNLFPDHYFKNAEKDQKVIIADNHNSSFIAKDVVAYLPKTNQSRKAEFIEHTITLAPDQISKTITRNQESNIDNRAAITPILPFIPTPKKLAIALDKSKEIVLATSTSEASGFDLAYLSEDENTFIELATAEILPIDVSPLVYERTFHTPIISDNSQRRNNSGKFLSLNLAPSINIVNSPYDFINKTQPYTTDAIGGEFGINYSSRKNRIEFETGLNYAKKSYNPRETKVSSTSAYKNTVLKDISYDILSFPLSIKFHAISTRNINLFAMAGSSFNNVVMANYEIEENGRPISPQARESIRGKKFNEGILNGGNYLDNIFITFDFGVGLERKISEDIYFVFAPTISTHLGLSGIGPNNDKVNSFSLNLGLKKRL